MKSLRKIAKKLENSGYSKFRKKNDLIDFIIRENGLEVLKVELNINTTDESVDSSKTNRIRIVITTITVFAAILTIIVHSSKILNWFNIDEEINGIDTKVTKLYSSNGIRIGIIPFLEVCNYDDRSLDVGYVIADRLKFLINRDSIEGNIIYFDEFDVNKNFDVGDAESFLRDYNLDQLIFGSYISKNCSSQNEFCINYISNDSIFIPINSYRVDYNSWQPLTLRELRNGSLQEEVDIIVYWVAAMNTIASDESRVHTIKYLNILEEKYDFKSTDLYNLRGNSYFLENKDSLAWVDFSRSLKTGKRYSDILYQRGSINANYFLNYAEALNDYNESISIDSTNGFAYFLRGATYFQIDSINLAIEDFENSLQLSPDISGSNYYLSACYIMTRNEDKAKKHAEICINRGDNDFIGYCYFLLGQVIFNFDPSNRDSAKVYFDLGLRYQPSLETEYNYYISRMSGKSMEEASEYYKLNKPNQSIYKLK